jgi:membrane fusion protein, heavy metal efflux system
MTVKSIVYTLFGLVAGLLIGSFVFRADTLSPSHGAPTMDLSTVPSLAASGHDESAAHSSHDHGAADWCVEHGVPESACTLCQPDLISVFQAKGDWCVEHGLPESIDRLCHPDLVFPGEPKSEPMPDGAYRPSVFFARNAGHCETDDAIIRFASAQTAERAGLAFAPALAIDQAAAAEAPAEILFDETRSYVVTTTVPALVSRWLVEPGENVRAGQPLAEMESPDIPRLKADYLDALASMIVETQEFSRADSLARLDLISRAEAQQAEGRLQSAQARMTGAKGMLQAVGLAPDDLPALDSGRTLTPRWLLRATTTGALVERRVACGELMPAGSTFALVGDPSALWIEANVREADLPFFRTGQTVTFSADGASLKSAAGTIIWVAQYIDPRTRTTTVRAKVTSPPPYLRAHQFGRIALPLTSTTPAIAVPRDAVQWEGCCNVVFVRESPTVYRPRKVTIAKGDRGYYNVTSGLNPGELVVVQGSFSLKTELRKGNLGAGCCDVASRP